MEDNIKPWELFGGTTEPQQNNESDVKPWEFFAEQRKQQSGPTARDRAAIRDSFTGNPLSCVPEENRAAIEAILATDPEGAEEKKKRIALSRYYSMNHPEAADFIFDNLEAAIEQFEGKPMSVEQAYASVAEMFQPQEYQMNRAEAAIKSGLVGTAKTAVNTTAFVASRLVWFFADWMERGFDLKYGDDPDYWEDKPVVAKTARNAVESAIRDTWKKFDDGTQEFYESQMRMPDGGWVFHSDSVADWTVNFGLSLVNYAPQLTTQMAMTMATGGVSALGIVFGIDGYYDIKEDETLGEVSETKALLYGLGVGLVNSYFEKVTLGIATGKVTEKYAKEGLKKGALELFKYLGISTAKEGGEEALEEFAENILDIAFGRRGDTKDWTERQWMDNLFQGMPEAFALGASTGAGMAALPVGSMREQARQIEEARGKVETRLSELKGKDELTPEEETELSALQVISDSGDPVQAAQAAVELGFLEKARKAEEEAARAEETDEAEDADAELTDEEWEQRETEAEEREAEEANDSLLHKHEVTWNKQDTIDRVNETAKQFPGFQVHAVWTFDDLPDAVRLEAKRRGVDTKQIQGLWFGENDVYVVADTTRPSETEKVVLHEIVGHAGLRRVFGEDFEKFLDDVFKTHRAEIEKSGLSALYNEQAETVEGQRYLTDEYLAKIAESNVKPGWWKEFLSKIRAYLRKVFPNIHFSDADIEHALAQSARTMRAGNGGTVQGPTLFSVSPVYTGSAADYEQPSTDYVGTGEGAQVYGWGLYGSESRGVGEYYAKADVRRKGEYVSPYQYAHQLANEAVTMKGGRTLDSEEILRRVDDLTETESAWEDISYILEQYLVEKCRSGFEGKISAEELRNVAFLRVQEQIALWKDDPRPTEEHYAKLRDFMQDESKKDEIEFRDIEIKPNKNRNLYKQTFWPDKEEDLLDWDLSIEPEQARKILNQMEKEKLFDSIPKDEELARDDAVAQRLLYLQRFLGYAADGQSNISSQTVYETLARIFKHDSIDGDPKAASEFLYRAGIDGVTYIGQESDKRNYVAFSDKDIRVDEHIRFALAGRRGVEQLNAQESLDNLKRAQEMERAGQDAKSIWINTGWERGTDGDWRMELPDLRVKSDELTAGGNYNALIDYRGPLDGYVDAPEIFKAYPELKQCEVEIVPLPRGTAGFYDYANKRIAVNRTLLTDHDFDALNDMEADKRDARTPEEASRIEANIKDYLENFKESLNTTLIHEVQHAIQHIEGFAHGTSPEEARFMQDSDDPVFTRAWRNMSDAWEELIQVLRNAHISDTVFETIDAWNEEYPRIYSLQSEFDRAVRRLVEMYGNGTDKETADRIVKLAHDIHLYNAEVYRNKRDHYDRYRRHAGEVEARNAEQRNVMNPEARLVYPPSATEDESRENQIVRFSITDSAAFQDWFKDSKVVDENGNPLVVYHDTNSKIYVNKETGENWDNLDWKARDEWDSRDDWDEHWEERDFYTFSRAHARRSVEYPGFFSPKADPYHEYGKRRIAAYLSIQNPAINPKIGDMGLYDDSGEVAMQKLIEQGYDGIIRTDEDGNAEEYIAFYPEQIKSVDNTGTFDRENPDIRFSVSPVYTGSSADYEKPDLHYVGTGEGQQVYGWGLYGSSSMSVARWYAENDVRRKGKSRPSLRVFLNGVEFSLNEYGYVLSDRGTGHHDEEFEKLSPDEQDALSVTLRLLQEYWRNARPTPEGLKQHVLKIFRNEARGELDAINQGYLWNRTEEEVLQKEAARKAAVDSLFSKIELKENTFIKNPHNVYTQTFWPNREENLLDWDAYTQHEQLQLIADEAVRENIEPYRLAYTENGINHPNIGGDGAFVYKQVVQALGSPKAASEFLYRAGIDGITYRGHTSSVRNYVAFSDKDVRVDDHIRFSLDAYSPDDQKKIVAILKPAARRHMKSGAFFVEPSQAKAYLDKKGLDYIDEQDAWSFYNEAQRQIREKNNEHAEQRKREDMKRRDKWYEETNLIWRYVVEQFGNTDITIIPSFTRYLGEKFTGTFINEEWRKLSEKRPREEYKTDKGYQKYLKRREEKLSSLSTLVGITSDDLARDISRAHGGLDEIDLEQEIIDFFRDLNWNKINEEWAAYKKQQEEVFDTEEEAAARAAYEASKQKSPDETREDEINDEAIYIVSRGEPITEEWAIEHPEVFRAVYKILMNGEEAPKSKKPSKDNLQAVNRALTQEGGNTFGGSTREEQIKTYMQAYKDARADSWEQYKAELRSIKEKVKANKADAVALQKQAAEFAEKNLPEEFRGTFTRGIVSLLEYSTSPSRKYPEGRRMHEFKALQDKITNMGQKKRGEKSMANIRKMLDAVKMKRNWKGIPVSIIPSEQGNIDRIRKIVDMNAATVANAIDFNNERIAALEMQMENPMPDDERARLQAEAEQHTRDNVLLDTFGNLAYLAPEKVETAEHLLENFIKKGKIDLKTKLGARFAEAEKLRRQAIDDATFGKNYIPDQSDARNHTAYMVKMSSLGNLMRIAAGKSIQDFDNSYAGELWRKIEDSTQNEQTTLRHLQEDFDAALEEFAGVKGNALTKMRKKGQLLRSLKEVKQESGVYKTEYSRIVKVDDAAVTEGQRRKVVRDMVPVEDYEYMGRTMPGARSILRAIDNGEPAYIAGKYGEMRELNLDETGIWFLLKQIEDYDAGIKRSYEIFTDKGDQDAFDKLREDEGKDKLMLLSHTRDEEARKVQVPLSQGTALQVLMTWEQDDFRPNMLWNGWTEESIEQIKKFLTPEAKRLGEWMRDYIAKKHDALDAAVYERYGAHLPQNPNYWPGAFRGTRSEEPSGGMRGAGTMSINPSFLIARKFHLKPLDMEADAFSMFFDNQIRQAHFLAWQDTIRQLREVYGNQRVQKAINDNFGKKVTDEIVEQIGSLARNGQIISSEWYNKRIFQNLYRYWVPAKIAINLSSVIKQGIGVFAYANDMPLVPFAKGLAKANFADRDFRAFVRWAKDSDYIKNRISGGMDRDLIYMLSDARDSAAYSPMMDALMSSETWFSRKADAWSALHGGFAVYWYNLEQAKKRGLNSADAERAARRAWMRATDETQQSGYLKDLNYFQQNQGLIRYLTAFRANPIQLMNLELRTLRELKYGDDKAAAGKKLARQILVNHIVVPTMMQFVTDMLRYGLDVFDEAEIEDYFIAWLYGPFESGVLYFQLANKLSHIAADLAIRGRTRQDATMSAVPIAEDVERDFKNIAKMAGDDEFTVEEAMDGIKAAGDIGMLIGAGYAPAGPIGSALSAIGTQGKRLWRLFSGDDDKKKSRK